MSSLTEPTIVDESGYEIVLPPNDLESDEPPLESDLHLLIIRTLLDCLEWLWRDLTDFYAAGNLTVYYNRHKIKIRDFRGPDFFVVLGTERRSRKSWIVWEEDGKYPNVIVEILSPSTANTDRGLKKQLYQDVFRTPDYFWFDPETLEFVGFHMVEGTYQPLPPNESGWLWSQQLQLFLGVHNNLLRFFTPTGELVATPSEVAQAEQEKLAQEQAKSARLAAKLRELGIDPDAI